MAALARPAVYTEVLSARSFWYSLLDSAVRLAAPAAASNALTQTKASGLPRVAGIRFCSYTPQGWHSDYANVKS